MSTPAELSRHFDRELEKLKQDLLRMAALAETAVGKSLVSVTDRDSDLAREVITDDITLNRMELAIEEQAFKMLALRQPVAHRHGIGAHRRSGGQHRGKGPGIEQQPPPGTSHRHQDYGGYGLRDGAHQH
jgi:hypothetical protein